MPPIKDHHVIIIGGTSGMGFAAASLALQEHAQVTIASSNSTRVETAVKALEASFPEGNIEGYVVDLESYDLEQILDQFLTNVTRYGTALLDPKLSLRYLRQQYTVSLTFTGGHLSDKLIANYSLYSALAAGLIGLTRNLALDMTPIRVNLVSPGATLTEMWGPNREQIGEIVGKNALLGKVEFAEEVGEEAFVYLMKDSNATGSVVNTNGPGGVVEIRGGL